MNRILVPLDGGPFSEQALRWATALARREKAAIDLVYVQPTMAPPDPDRSLVEAAEATRDEIGRHVTELATRMAASNGLSVTSLVLDGDPAAEIDRFAVRSRSDLIVMCTHGRGPTARLWLGSVADRLLRLHAGTILFVPPGATPAAPPIASALIPLDGSALSERAIAPALALLAPGARVLLARCVEAPTVATFAFEMPVLPPSIPLTDLTALARDYLQRHAEHLRRAGMDAHTVVGNESRVAEWILEVARREQVQLIALATHGLGGVRRLMLGSVADKVIRGAGVAVLAYRPEERA